MLTFAVHFICVTGVSWTVLQQLSSSTVWTNTVVYTSSHDNCQFISYTANANSPNGYHKTLIIYGGGTTTANVGVITVSTATPNCTTPSDATVVLGELLLPCEIACNYNGVCPAGVSCAAAAPGSSSSAGSTGAVANSTSTGTSASANTSTSTSASVSTSSSSAASTASTVSTVSSTTSAQSAASTASTSSTGAAATSVASSASTPSATSSSTAAVSTVSSSSAAGPSNINAAQRSTSSTASLVVAALSIALALVIVA